MILDGEKVFDQSCYYCIYSKSKMSIRNPDKNTCNIINNKGWTSEEIRHCPYRVKMTDKEEVMEKIIGWILVSFFFLFVISLIMKFVSILNL